MNQPAGHDEARRRFLVGSAAAAGGVAAAAGSAAAPASAGPFELAVGASVVLHDQRIGLDAGVVQRLAANGARLIALQGDPVRLWRSEVGALLRDPSTRLFGVTRWADLLIVRGLAAETRRHLQYERLDPEAGTFTWLIA